MHTGWPLNCRRHPWHPVGRSPEARPGAREGCVEGRGRRRRDRGRPGHVQDQQKQIARQLRRFNLLEVKLKADKGGGVEACPFNLEQEVELVGGGQQPGRIFVKVLHRDLDDGRVGRVGGVVAQLLKELDRPLVLGTPNIDKALVVLVLRGQNVLLETGHLKLLVVDRLLEADSPVAPIEANLLLLLVQPSSLLQLLLSRLQLSLPLFGLPSLTAHPEIFVAQFTSLGLTAGQFLCQRAILVDKIAHLNLAVVVDLGNLVLGGLELLDQLGVGVLQGKRVVVVVYKNVIIDCIG